MAIGLLGRKIGMTQVYEESGEAVPVTVIEAGPCTVLALRTPERDGYHAVQLGYLDRPRRLATRPERGHVVQLDSKRAARRRQAGVTLPAKANCEPKRLVREIRMQQGADYEVGQELTVDVFAEVDAVDVIGTSKGRGFTGVMKRHGFGGLPASHGVKRRHRAAGGIGGHATDLGKSGRIKKGKRMAGQHGNSRCTVRNLKVVRVDPERHLLLVRGAIPGANGGFVLIRETNKLDR
jgi:large subunit ribosomal protein L3